jgi:outer membrane protein insertion porin family/translocation and assembly module TamA
VGGELAVTRQIATDVPLEASYSLSYGRTIAAPATFCVLLDVCTFEDQAVFRQRRLRSVIGLSAVRDRTNSVNDATRGNILVTELRVSPSFLGSDRYMRFARLTAGFTAHHQFGTDSLGRVISWRIRGGWVLAPRDEVPFEERFFTGGSTTVRGFGENQLGPVVYVMGADSTIRTSATGGTYMGVANLEARFPVNVLGIQLFGAVFADAGYIDNLRITPGVGVRMPSLLGPIRLDIAFNPYASRVGPLYGQTGTDLALLDPAYQPKLGFFDRLQLHLSIGQAF